MQRKMTLELDTLRVWLAHGAKTYDFKQGLSCCLLFYMLSAKVDSKIGRVWCEKIGMRAVSGIASNHEKNINIELCDPEDGTNIYKNI